MGGLGVWVGVWVCGWVGVWVSVGVREKEVLQGVWFKRYRERVVVST